VNAQCDVALNKFVIGPMSVRTLYLILVGFTISSCVIPTPHRRIHWYGVKGQLLDSLTKQPVVAASIRATPEGKRVSISDAKGRFVIEPIYGWHGAYLIGPISLSLFPGFDMPGSSRYFHVTADGYESKDIHLPFPTPRIPESRNFFDAGITLLQRNAKRR
jgi:hypothetical protein